MTKNDLGRSLHAEKSHHTSCSYMDLDIAPPCHDFLIFLLWNFTGLYSNHVPIVPVLVESWSGQVNSGPW